MIELHSSFVRAFELEDRSSWFPLCWKCPITEESIIELDYLGDEGQALLLRSDLIEDSVAHVVDYGFLERRYMMVSFLVDEDHPEVCLCAKRVKTAGSVAPGFAMLGQSSLEELLVGV